MFNKIDGGFILDSSDAQLVNQQRAITKHINDQFIQVGAIYLKTSDKNPFEDDWYDKRFHDVDLQTWIDDPDSRLTNVGFNLQLGWMDVDIDSEDALFNKCIVAAMAHLGLDTRFRFGRFSVGAPTHLLVQLGEDESANWEMLKIFEPKPFKVSGKRFHTQLRSYPTNVSAKNVAKSAKQTVMPGSIYKSKNESTNHDISVWYTAANGPATSIREIAQTTPRKVSFNEVIRAIAFGTLAYVVHDKWLEGSRHTAAQKVAGWLARVVREGQGLNNNESTAGEVYCPVDDDDIAESLLKFVCDYYGDDEGPMRIRTYRDACSKIDMNPDAKIPGWPALTELLGADRVIALRTVFMPGSDVHLLTKFAERYLYDESDNQYIDRDRFLSAGRYVHEGHELERRHKGDVVRISGKPREAFKIFESSTLRKRVGGRDLYPDLSPGGVYRITGVGKVLSDDNGEDASALAVFNTWRGWPLLLPEVVDDQLLERCVEHLDKLLGYLTRNNVDQGGWLKKWIAWIIQHPGIKQQIAPVIVGGQGVGKSFLGNTFMQALFHGLWGTASPRLLEGAFSVEPFIDKMFVFMDEARFRGDSSTEEIKKLIRNIDVSGSEKYISARNYRIHSRMMFASNRMDMNIGQHDVQDRALFYIKAYDKDYLKLNEREFLAWSAKLKPWFMEFAAFIEKEEVMRHYMYYFMTLPVTKYEVESLEHSSSNDADIVASNMSWPRRVAKYIIEDGRIYEDLDISYPWTPADLNRRVVEVCKEIGMQSIHGARVLNEFKDAGVIETHAESGKNYYRFKSKYGSLVKEYGEAIAVPLETLYEFKDEDFGPNTCTMKDRPPWRGGKEKFYGKF
jgi:hypothetical protein